MGDTSSAISSTPSFLDLDSRINIYVPLPEPCYLASIFTRPLFEKKTLECFPAPVPGNNALLVLNFKKLELGRKITPLIHRPRPININKGKGKDLADPQFDLNSWKPEGILIGNLNEHRAQVNQVILSPDNEFFVSCSNDGSTKIWDTQRLEKNATNRSRATISVQGFACLLLIVLKFYCKVEKLKL